jgi:hypothetical protein
VVSEYGFERANLVLAKTVQSHDWDARYSSANKKWAADVHVPERAFDSASLNAHPVLIDDFVMYAREMYKELDAERFALPGRPESGAAVQNYAILRSIQFNNDRGFAIGRNPEAVSEFATWQFTTENGKREFYWGHYADTMEAAAQNFAVRVGNYLRDEQVREVQNPIKAVEISTEQNYNMIDGARNNLAVPKADLTDGQTYEELRELAPEALTEEKPSVLAQIREAKKEPAKPSPKKQRENGTPDLER